MVTDINLSVSCKNFFLEVWSIRYCFLIIQHLQNVPLLGLLFSRVTVVMPIIAQNHQTLWHLTTGDRCTSVEICRPHPSKVRLSLIGLQIF